MCGIAAMINFSHGEITPLLRAMMDAVRHRGPDDEGVTLFHGDDSAPRVFGGPDTPAQCFSASVGYAPEGLLPNVVGFNPFLALGHRRLSIVDVSPTGHQPMCSPDRRHWITYNGEIYNHIELREELKQLGYEFVSRSDTEVILAAYREWGLRCLERFNGMFAFILFDRISMKLFFARDRFGVKPLYFWHSSAGFWAAASEIKQFTALPGWRAVLNGQRGYDFLNWGLFDHTRETLFCDVFQLRGGECAEIDLISRVPEPVVNRWYELRPRPFSSSYEEATRAFRHLFLDSVRLRLRSDVPVGSCLSGGLDSSSIVCAVSSILHEQGLNANQNTFSARCEVESLDEGRYIEEVVRKSEAAAAEVSPGLNGLLDILSKIAWHQDEPFGSTSIYAQWEVFHLAARNGVKVMLDGQGADELLAGYPGFRGPFLAGLLRHGRIWTLLAEIATQNAQAGATPARAMKQLLDTLLPEALRQPLRSMLGYPTAIPSWLDFEKLGAKPADPTLDRGRRPASLHDFSKAQLVSTHLPMLLHWEDRNSMAHSVEARVPFLDYRLVEYALGLPDAFKLHRATTKRILRTAMEGMLPDMIRERRDKLAFATAEQLWMTRSAPSCFRMLLKRSIESSGGIVRNDVLDDFDAMVDGSRPFSAAMWRIISFGQWIACFGVRATGGQ